MPVAWTVTPGALVSWVPCAPSLTRSAFPVGRIGRGVRARAVALSALSFTMSESPPPAVSSARQHSNMLSLRYRHWAPTASPEGARSVPGRQTAWCFEHRRVLVVPVPPHVSCCPAARLSYQPSAPRPRATGQHLQTLSANARCCRGQFTVLAVRMAMDSLGDLTPCAHPGPLRPDIAGSQMERPHRRHCVYQVMYRVISERSSRCASLGSQAHLSIE